MTPCPCCAGETKGGCHVSTLCDTCAGYRYRLMTCPHELNPPDDEKEAA